MLEINDEARVRLIRFNRPEALNAFNDELYHAAGAALSEAAASPDIACVVLTGTGRGFSAGQDLGEMGRLSTDATPADFGDAGPGFPRFLDTLAA
ncbi:MAG TPA: enoyl-CoA hydratase-related protein, partial [Acidimicrobiia bacterium]|nr:enoyl-CoA hydratase-related protein [Acidimicrobiia bacterium]